MDNYEPLSLSEIVNQNHRAAAVFEKFSLDFCCNGNRKILEACKEANIDPIHVINELKTSETKNSDGRNFKEWPLHETINYIQTHHHAYIEQQSPQIKKYLNKICGIYGDRHPELWDVRAIFSEVAGELAVHMKKEELMLFPFMKKLERARDTHTSGQSPLFETVASPIEMMKADHAAEGEKLSRIAYLTGNYTAPDDACNTFIATYELLKEFEKDLHIHIHLENNIVFPKAIVLEKLLHDEGNFAI